MSTIQQKKRPALFGYNLVRLIVFAAVLLCCRIIPADAESAVTGVVVEEKSGKPIENARVRIASPEIDLRGVLEERAGIFDGITDASGHFSIPVPENEKISVNVLARGFQEAAGMWMRGNMGLSGLPFPSKRADLTIKLSPGLYVAGTVVDEAGHPVSVVKFESSIRDETNTGYVVFGEVDARGRFEIFAFPSRPEGAIGNPNARGEVSFQSPNFLTYFITNIYSLTDAERANLRITLLRGHDIKGTVRLADGTPAAGEKVICSSADKSTPDKFQMADSHGKFEIRGVGNGKMTIRAHSLKLNQKARVEIEMAGANIATNLQMRPLVLNQNPQSVLGMTLASETPELRDAYDLFASNGVIVIAPGTNTVELGIGNLAAGDCFWLIGEKSINDLHEMMSEISRINYISPPGDSNEGCHGHVRVVYEKFNASTTDTQWLTLSDEKAIELKKLLGTIKQ